jgi:hypothetical protein
VDLQIDSLNLMPDRYTLSFWVTCSTDFKVYDGDVRTVLDVEPADVFGSARALNKQYGIVYFPHSWKLPQAEQPTTSAAESACGAAQEQALG